MMKLLSKTFLLSTVLISYMYSTENQKKNSIHLEIGGPGIIYTLNYDRNFNSFLGISIGYAFMPKNIFFIKHASIIPLYLRFYFFPRLKQKSNIRIPTFYASLGSVLLISDFFVPVVGFGFGYEYDKAEHFVFKSSIYFATFPTIIRYAIKTYTYSFPSFPWIGFSFGYKF